MVDRKWHTRSRPQGIRVGKHFLLSDFLYSQTAVTRGIPNIPPSWTCAEIRGIKGLCKHILDPVVEEFGAVSVTFGFCSLQLWKHWYPSKDNPVALHLFKPPQGGIGGAADIMVHSHPTNVRPVCNWIRQNCEYDRLIMYPGSAIICVAWTEVKPRYHAKEWIFVESESAQYVNAGWDKAPMVEPKEQEERQGTLFFDTSEICDCSTMFLSRHASLLSLISQ